MPERYRTIVADPPWDLTTGPPWGFTAPTKKVPYPTMTVEEIKEGIEGNFCRCTGYEQIVETVLDVSGQLDASSKGALKYV